MGKGITQTLCWFYNLLLFYTCGRLCILRLHNSLCFYTTGRFYASTVLLYADCYRIFSIKRRTPNKCRVQINAGSTALAEFKINAPAFIRGPDVYLRSRRLFETSMLNQDYHDCVHSSSLSTILFEFYPLI